MSQPKLIEEFTKENCSIQSVDVGVPSINKTKIHNKFLFYKKVETSNKNTINGKISINSKTNRVHYSACICFIPGCYRSTVIHSKCSTKTELYQNHHFLVVPPVTGSSFFVFSIPCFKDSNLFLHKFVMYRDISSLVHMIVKLKNR